MAIKSQKSQKIMVMIVSIILAFFLWLYVMGEKNPIQNKILADIPVSLTNVEAITKDNLVLSPNQKFSVDVLVTGRAFDISKIIADDVKLEADLSSINKKGANKILIKFSNVQKNTTLTAKNGQNYINVKVDTLVEKNVPVIVNVRGNVKDGYAYLKPISRPTEVVVSGPGDYIDAVFAAVGHISVSGNNANKSGSILLTPQDKNGIPVSYVNVVPTYIDTTVSIKPSKELPVKVSTYGVQDSKKVIKSIKPQIERIVIVGEHKYIDKLNEIKTTALDLSKISKTSTIQLPLNLPEGISVVEALDGIKIDVVVENRLDKIMTINPPIINKDSDYNYTVSEEQISVVLSGPESAINALSEKSVEAYIDVNGYPEGTHEIPITISPIQDIEVRNISPLKISVDIIKK